MSHELERGSALVAAMAAAVIMAVVFHCEVADAATYLVGKSDLGWTIGNTPYYPDGKKLKVGDILVFSYTNGVHNVVKVDKHGYDNCTISPPGAKPYTSGDDQIRLNVTGSHYFVCTKRAGHCSTHKMKIVVNVG